ncbi:MAG: hypothetical protein JSV97_02135 [candidate division WOR-3 bacterium]|nr:MAG: hypothetical protein JSV97_02135 [candidate division WOR-3 bacterium]
MIVLVLVLNTLVYQNGDTLFFTVQDSVADTWILGDEIQKVDTLNITIHRKAKISPDGKSFFVFEETHTPNNIQPLQTKIIFYDEEKEKIWEESNDDQRKLSFKLSNVFDSLVIIVDTERNGTLPRLSTYKNREKTVIIEKGEWQRMVNYAVSPHCRYMAFHNRNPYSGKMWDYIYSIDLLSKKNWTYLFPLCLSCKRGKINLTIDNNGTVEVIHKGEHRIFSSEGNLKDFFIK